MAARKAKLKREPKRTVACRHRQDLSVEDEYALNCKVANRILREAGQHPGRWQQGQYVGLVRGKVVAVSFDWDEVHQALCEREPDWHRTMLIQITPDFDKPELEPWSREVGCVEEKLAVSKRRAGH